jgi:hypothetical protein
VREALWKPVLSERPNRFQSKRLERLEVGCWHHLRRSQVSQRRLRRGKAN